MIAVLWMLLGFGYTFLAILYANMLKRAGKVKPVAVYMFLSVGGPVVIGLTFPWAALLPWAVCDAWVIGISCVIAWGPLVYVDRHIDAWVAALERSRFHQAINTPDPGPAVRTLVVDVADQLQRSFVAPVANRRQRRRYDAMSLHQLVK